MTKLWLLSVCLLIVPKLVSATTAPPCERTYGLSSDYYPSEPLAPLQPVPSDGSFLCRGIRFDDFSDNIRDGGLVGASFAHFWSGVAVPNLSGDGFLVVYPGDIVRFTVEPLHPELGFSFRVTGMEMEFINTPIRFAGLPPLNHIASGNPTLTASIDGIDFTAGVEGSGYTELPDSHDFPHKSFYVIVKPEDIQGGEISRFSVVFATPEPSTWTFAALGLGVVGWKLFARKLLA